MAFSSFYLCVLNVCFYCEVLCNYVLKGLRFNCVPLCLRHSSTQEGLPDNFHQFLMSSSVPPPVAQTACVMAMRFLLDHFCFISATVRPWEDSSIHSVCLMLSLWRHL